MSCHRSQSRSLLLQELRKRRQWAAESIRGLRAEEEAEEEAEDESAKHDSEMLDDDDYGDFEDHVAPHQEQDIDDETGPPDPFVSPVLGAVSTVPAQLETYDEDILFDEDEYHQPTSPAEATTFRRATPPVLSTWLQEDEMRHERLMQRHQAMQRADHLSNIVSAESAHSDIAAGVEEERVEDTQLNTEQSQEVGSSLASSVSSRSVRAVEAVIDENEQRREQALKYLESLVLGLFTQIDTSLATLDQPEQPTCRSLRKRKRDDGGSDDEAEAEESDDEGDVTKDLDSQTFGIKVTMKNRQTGNDSVMAFPDDPLASGSKDPSLVRLSCVYTISAALYDAILTHTVVTLRDIFYRDKMLFKRQAVVDKMVDDLVQTAGLKRRDFYVCASAKGLVASSAITIHRRSGETVLPSPTSATLIDPIEKIERIEAPEGVGWVLVVEKDAVFQTLCSARLLCDERLGPGVLITGKGYPDLATKQFVKLIADTYPDARLFALVDADPHGLAILSTYVCGPKKNRYSLDHSDLALGSRMEWLGLRASDWKGVSQAMSMLRRPDLPTEWKRELSHALHLNRKVEIEIVLSSTALGSVSEPVPLPSCQGERERTQYEPTIGSAPGSIFDDQGSLGLLSIFGETAAAARTQNRSDGGAGEGGAAKLVEYIVGRIRADHT